MKGRLSFKKMVIVLLTALITMSIQIDCVVYYSNNQCERREWKLQKNPLILPGLDFAAIMDVLT